MVFKNKKQKPSNGWAAILFVIGTVCAVLFYYEHHRPTPSVPPGATTKPVLGTVRGQRFASSWIRAQDISGRGQNKILADIKGDTRRPETALWLNQAALLYPTIQRLCLSANVDPDVITGLIIQESQGSPLAVDYAFTNGSSKYSHIGLGQLNSGRLSTLLPRLSKKQVAKKLQRIAHLAFQWRKHRKDASGKVLFNEWVKQDPRFDALANLTQTIKEFKANQALSGDTTLAIMAHHGGAHDPLNRVAQYRHLVDPAHPPISTRGVAQYVQAHHLSYFTLAESNDKGARYWSEKGNGHLTYCYSVTAWIEMFCRFRASSLSDRQKAARMYPGEVPFLVVRQIEHTLWWRGKPFYRSANDLKKAKAAGTLVEVPLTLASDGMVLTPVGQKDPVNSKLYSLATKRVWQVIGELSRRARARSVHPKTYRIESLVRTVTYSHLMGRGAPDTSHNFGGAFDISLKEDVGTLTNLHHTLYEMAQDGTLSYYIESNTSYAGTLAVFPTPYHFYKAGQVHVIVNPYK